MQLTTVKLYVVDINIALFLYTRACKRLYIETKHMRSLLSPTMKPYGLQILQTEVLPQIPLLYFQRPYINNPIKLPQ